MGYTERDDLPVGPVSLVTHSGSVFSTLLRTRLRLGFDLAVSSGQELVTTTADYVDHVVDHTETRVLALVLETIRGGARLRWSLRRAREAGIEVVLLPVGHSPLGSAMVAAHSGAVAGGSAAWEALADDVAGHLVGDLAELADTLALLVLAAPAPTAAVRWPPSTTPAPSAAWSPTSPTSSACASRRSATRRSQRSRPGSTTASSPATRSTCGAVAPTPASSSATAWPTIAADPAVGVTALAVDLVPEYDGDTSYPDAVLDVVATTDQPVVVLSGLASGVDEAAADRLRQAGVPVLEGFRSGLLALRHLQDAVDRPAPDLARWLRRLTTSSPSRNPRERTDLLAAYGIPTPGSRPASTRAAAQAAAADLGWPVVLKTAAPGITHRSDVGGVVTDLHDLAAVGAAYDDLADRLGPDVTVHQQVPAGVEVSVGIVRDDALGPDGGGRGGRRAGRAAGRPRRRAAAAHPRRGAADARPAAGCGRCSTACAARRPPTSTRWPRWSWRCRGWPTSAATSWPRST